MEKARRGVSREIFRLVSRVFRTYRAPRRLGSCIGDCIGVICITRCRTETFYLLRDIAKSTVNATKFGVGLNGLRWESVILSNRGCWFVLIEEV